MVDGKILIEKLLRYAQKFLHLREDDLVYTRNLLLREFHLSSPAVGSVDVSDVDALDVPDTLVKEMNLYAEENSLADSFTSHLFSAHILGLLTPAPSVINDTFNSIRKDEGIQPACNYLYNISVKNDYIQKTAIGKNLKWEYADGDNILEITINLSKPEKDNKDIAKLLTKSASTGEKYPACALCEDNLGYGGTATHPARSNIRTVNVTLGGEEWFVQYSPYAYYNEHLIAINKAHTPMTVNPKTPEKLLDFVDIFPNYFIGSNAALPIVGGSILNHEHYQGGGHILPMRKCPIAIPFTSKRYPSVKGGILNWYNSALRLTSKNKQELIDATAEFITRWNSYTDEAVGIFAETDGVPHNTLSPIASKGEDGYVMDIILRNNITTEEYPDGKFHAHPEYFNIKKEGIGLIEAMGLFILPGRLKRQTAEIENILTGESSVGEDYKNTSHDLFVHRDMIDALKAKAGGKVEKSVAAQLVTDYINEVCAKILECTAVFKRDACGTAAFVRFVEGCTFKCN